MLAGMDYVVQARSGLMASNGRLADGLPSAGDSPIADYMCAALLAFGVSAALFRRERTGLGGEVELSLLGAAMSLQATLFTRVASADAESDEAFLDWLAKARAEGVPFSEQLKQTTSARPSFMQTVYYRTYATRDSALAVACGSPALRRKFMAATGMEDPLLGRSATREETAGHYATLQRAMEARMSERTTAEWKSVLDGAGVPASPVVLPVELLHDEQVRLNGLIYEVDHPAVGKTTLLGPPVHLDDDGFRPAAPALPLGSEARAILAGLGLAADEIEAAIGGGAVRAD
jgi:crotonobetainyl-CoA:carnitine CoA-transferase CaiB-like acyl-CoA transferase